MLDDFFKGLACKYWHPCKKCLVQVTCNPSPHDKTISMLTTKCDKYKTFLNRRDLVDSLGDGIDVWTAISCLAVGIILILVKFGFGCWKWVEIIFY